MTPYTDIRCKQFAYRPDGVLNLVTEEIYWTAATTYKVVGIVSKPHGTRAPMVWPSELQTDVEHEFAGRDLSRVRTCRRIDAGRLGVVGIRQHQQIAQNGEYRAVRRKWTGPSAHEQHLISPMHTKSIIEVPAASSKAPRPTTNAMRPTTRARSSLRRAYRLCVDRPVYALLLVDMSHVPPEPATSVAAVAISATGLTILGISTGLQPDILLAGFAGGLWALTYQPPAPLFRVPPPLPVLPSSPATSRRSPSPSCAAPLLGDLSRELAQTAFGLLIDW